MGKQNLTLALFRIKPNNINKIIVYLPNSQNNDERHILNNTSIPTIYPDKYRGMVEIYLL